MTLRRGIFWTHLIAGIVCGLVIALMAATGATYAFQDEILAFTRRDVARVVPEATPRVSPDEILRSVRLRNPDATPAGIVIHADPAAATQVMMGREKPSLYANPYTGELKEDRAVATGEFLAFTLRLHRWLALGGDGRAVGKAITGACSAAFLLLSVTGLYLWWPRHLNLRSLRPSTTFIRGARGKARDWNWHNVLGFWSLPLLILLSSTGMVMSYRWASNLLYIVAGETPPPAAAKPGETPAPVIAPPEPGARPLTYETLLGRAQTEVPDWASISFRMPSAGRAGAGANSGVRRTNDKDATSVGSADNSREPERPAQSGRSAPGAPAVSVIIRRADTLPLTAAVTLTLDPYTGETLTREGFSDKSAGGRLRYFARYAHTGEAFGLPGKFVMFLAALVTLVLVYTGFALSWRRFFPGKKARHHQHRGDGHKPPAFNTPHTPPAE